MQCFDEVYLNMWIEKEKKMLEIGICLLENNLYIWEAFFNEFVFVFVGLVRYDIVPVWH